MAATVKKARRAIHTAVMSDAAAANAGNRNPQIERTRKALRDGFVALLLEKSLEQITNQELAASARVGYSTLFRHYSSKEELLRDIVKIEIAQMIEVSAPLIDKADARSACVALCGHVAKHRPVWRVLMKQALNQVREECIRLTLLSRPKKNRDRHQPWIPVELGVQIGVASTLEIIAWMTERSDQLSVDQAVEALDRMIVGPAFAD